MALIILLINLNLEAQEWNDWKCFFGSYPPQRHILCVKLISQGLIITSKDRLMGSWTSNFCKTNGQGEEYIKRLEETIQLIEDNSLEKQLLRDYREKLVEMLDDAQPFSDRIGNIYIQVILAPSVYRIESRLSQAQMQPKLIIKLPSGQGYIVIPEACYFGQIYNNQAHGYGSIFIPRFKITGKWNHDSFLQGEIIKYSPQVNGTSTTLLQTRYCMLKLNNLEEAFLSTDDFDYNGSITIKDAKSVNDMLTGTGTIVYKSHGEQGARPGDQYKGRMVKGRFDSGENLSTYTYSKFASNESIRILKFQGCYTNGMREKEGQLTIEVQGALFQMHVNYFSGVPLGKGCVKSIDYGSIQFDLGSNGIVLGSKITGSQIN